MKDRQRQGVLFMKMWMFKYQLIYQENSVHDILGMNNKRMQDSTLKGTTWMPNTDHYLGQHY